MSWTQPDGYLLSLLGAAIEEMLRTQAQDSGGRRLLDLGCGDRRYEQLARSLGFEYVGADLGDGQDLKLTDGEPVPSPSGSFDVVLSTQVLEHVWDVGWYLRECRRLLKPTGALILSTHGVWPYHPHPTDFHRWTSAGLVREIETHGLRVERVTPVLGPLAWTTQFRVLGIWKMATTRIPMLKPLVPPVCLVTNSWLRLQDAVTPRRLVETDASIYVTQSRPTA